jgi:hypothetical protein
MAGSSAQCSLGNSPSFASLHCKSSASHANPTYRVFYIVAHRQCLHGIIYRPSQASETRLLASPILTFPVKCHVSARTSAFNASSICLTRYATFVRGSFLFSGTLLSTPTLAGCTKHESAIAMALIVDKHRPKSLDALTYHPDLSARLRSLVIASQATLRALYRLKLTNIDFIGAER